MEQSMKSIRYLSCVVVFFVGVGRAQAMPNAVDDTTVVATIDTTYVITLKALRQYIADWRYQNRFRAPSDIYRNALKDLITYRLRIFDFFDRGLNEDQGLMDTIRHSINNELMNSFFDKNFVNKFVNDRTIAEAYKEMGKEIICTDIILPIPAPPTKEHIDSLKTLALKIEPGLHETDDVKGLMKRSSVKGYKLNAKRKVTWSEGMVDPVANVIFRLPKGVTRVIEALDGFHIVKVVEVRKVTLEPFEKMKAGIVSQLQKGYYESYNKTYDDFRHGLIDKSSIKWNQRGLDQIVKWSSENPTFYGGAYKDTIQNAISNGNNFEILSSNIGKVDLKEYLRLLKEVILLNPNIVLNPDLAKEFILEALYDNCVIQAAKKLGLEKTLLNPYVQSVTLEDRLIYLYNQTVIDGSIPEATPEALQKFYDDHKDSIFYQLKRMNVYARIYSDSGKAAADIEEIKKGTPFEKVSESWWVKTYIRERDGSLKSYRSNEPPYLAKAAFALELHESAGPIEFYDSAKGRQFAVIECAYVEPEKQLTYNDVKGKRLNDEFRNYYRRTIADNIDAALRKKHHVEIFEKVLSGAIASKAK